MPSRSRSRSWRGVGWGMMGGSWPLAGMIFRVASASRMSRPVGDDGPSGRLPPRPPAANPPHRTMPSRRKASRFVDWQILKRVGSELADLAEWVNPVVGPVWMNYYGRFSRSRLYRLLQRINTCIMRWARNKYRQLGNFKKARRWRTGRSSRPGPGPGLGAVDHRERQPDDARRVVDRDFRRTRRDPRLRRRRRRHLPPDRRLAAAQVTAPPDHHPAADLRVPRLPPRHPLRPRPHPALPPRQTHLRMQFVDIVQAITTQVGQFCGDPLIRPDRRRCPLGGA
jgi:hypothetical protein